MNYVITVAPHLCRVWWSVHVVDVCHQILALYSDRVSDHQQQSKDSSPSHRTSSPVLVSGLLTNIFNPASIHFLCCFDTVLLLLTTAKHTWIDHVWAFEELWDIWQWDLIENEKSRKWKIWQWKKPAEIGQSGWCQSYRMCAGSRCWIAILQLTI